MEINNQTDSNQIINKEPKPRAKRKPKQSRLNRWSVFGMVFLSALLIVVYVNNVIKIDGMLLDIQNLKKKYSELKYQNQALSTTINELQSPDVIIKKAGERLKMIKPDEAPELIK